MAVEALPREYRARAGRTASLCVAAGLGTVPPLLPLLLVEGVPGWVGVVGVVLVAGLIGSLAFAASRCGTVVDLDGIRVRGVFRSTRLRWAEIQALHAEEELTAVVRRYGPRVIANAYRSDGRRVPLRYVDDVHVSSVRDEVELMRAAWAALRGPDWRPSAEVSLRIARRDAARTGLLAGMFWGTAALIGTGTLSMFMPAGEVPDWLLAVLVLAVPLAVFLLVWLASYRRNR
ncbi:PH domain-containing protein [Allostreptomyces psammosilenae]|uniref:Low molecular weight protein antigen 6 PH domain-containing protein n=1 Tax=Allostreptomyces psammosilenae TaxID=1892865 RepID=A0A853AAM2_9ACTN|nr:PH domain-containing protein [Allostreptomyces psammosilenae]NYI07671.1 hypothetical protein [Allostreptomyces psammosilenae]